MNDPVATLESALRRGQNADGGWGYYADKQSRLEPTCWALLSLADSDVSVLRKWPARNGMLLEHPEAAPNFAFHGLGLLTLLGLNAEHTLGNRALLSSLQNVKGIQLKQTEFSRQNNSLQGWSWISETFSWVEPTAWCLLSLKKSMKKGLEIDRGRVAEAEALLFDRSCAGGGWNYGTSNVMGKQHEAYVPTTAVTLLSLQDQQSRPEFSGGLAYLRRNSESEQSSVALSLACMALSVLKQPTESVRSALSRQLPVTMAVGNQCALALALYALRTDHEYAALRF